MTFQKKKRKKNEILVKALLLTIVEERSHIV